MRTGVEASKLMPSVTLYNFFGSTSGCLLVCDSANHRVQARCSGSVRSSFQGFQRGLIVRQQWANFRQVLDMDDFHMVRESRAKSPSDLVGC